MRKNLALLLACSMMLGLTACGGGGTETTAAATEAATQAPAETPAAAEGDKGEGAEAPAEGAGDMEALIEAAKAEGELTVYGSCEEEYLSLACKNFEDLYGIKTKFQRLSTSEVYTKISEEAGKPSLSNSYIFIFKLHVGVLRQFKINLQVIMETINIKPEI